MSNSSTLNKLSTQTEYTTHHNSNIAS